MEKIYVAVAILKEGMIMSNIKGFDNLIEESRERHGKFSSEGELIEKKAVAYLKEKIELDRRLHKLSQTVDVDNDEYWNYIALMEMGNR